MIESNIITWHIFRESNLDLIPEEEKTIQASENSTEEEVLEIYNSSRTEADKKIFKNMKFKVYPYNPVPFTTKVPHKLL